LQLACGTVHEAMAMARGDEALAADGRAPKLQTDRNPFEEAPATRSTAIQNPVGAARSIRDRHLKSAQRALEAAFKSDPTMLESQIRLANVRIIQGNDAAASSLLTPLLDRSLPPREAYLSRLLLSRVKARARDFAAVARLLNEAVQAMPSGQSAYVGLADAQARLADDAAAAATLRRMISAPRTPDDPWVSYRFGQYWVPDALVGELRSEVRK
jgi:thioredoxin-like negative regulator of GroEL